MHRTSACLALAIVAFANSAAAQLADRLELRTLRQEAGAAPLRIAKTDARPEWTVDVGLGYVDGQDGSDTFATPFNLKAPLGESKADLRIAGEGYQYIDAGDSDSAGLADILLALSYTFAKGAHKLIPEAGFYFPTGGEAGSSSWRQRVGLAYVTQIGERMSFATKGRAVRRSEDPDPGVSRITSTLAADLGFALKENVSEASVSFSRSYRSGVGGFNEAGVGYSHRLGASTVSLGYSRGLTEGAKNNSFEATIGRPF